MANNNKRKNRYLVLQRIVTALLTVSLTLLVALGIYAFPPGLRIIRNKNGLSRNQPLPLSMPRIIPVLAATRRSSLFAKA